jgi:hypothetical protein
MECPYKLEGCGAKPPRSELDRHKSLCEYAPDKVAASKQKKVQLLKEKKETILQQDIQFKAKEKSMSNEQRKQEQLRIGLELYNLSLELYTHADYKECIQLTERALILLTESKVL